jgi:hypothetical protein
MVQWTISNSERPKRKRRAGRKLRPHIFIVAAKRDLSMAPHEPH